MGLRSFTSLSMDDPRHPPLPKYDGVEIVKFLTPSGEAMVYKGRYKGEDVAVKVYHCSGSMTGVIKRFREEFEALMALQHPNILRLVTLFETNAMGKLAPCVLTAYMDGGDLCDYLREKGALETASARVLGRGIGKGLAYLHSKGYAHRDMKTQNVLLKGGGRLTPVIADFGLAKMSAMTRMTHVAGTPGYMAPEVYKGKLGQRGDVYAFGVVLWEMISGQVPWEGEELDEIQKKTKAGIRPVILRDRWDRDLCNLVEECWAQEPSRRPSMDKVCQRLGGGGGSGDGTSHGGSHGGSHGDSHGSGKPKSIFDPGLVSSTSSSKPSSIFGKTVETKPKKSHTFFNLQYDIMYAMSNPRCRKCGSYIINVGSLICQACGKCKNCAGDFCE